MEGSFLSSKLRFHNFIFTGMTVIFPVSTRKEIRSSLDRIESNRAPLTQFRAHVILGMEGDKESSTLFKDWWCLCIGFSLYYGALCKGKQLAILRKSILCWLLSCINFPPFLFSPSLQISERRPLHTLPRSYHNIKQPHSSGGGGSTNLHPSHHRQSGFDPAGSNKTFDAEQESEPRIGPNCVGRLVKIGGVKKGVLRYYGRTHFQVGTRKISPPRFQ